MTGIVAAAILVAFAVYLLLDDPRQHVDRLDAGIGHPGDQPSGRQPSGRQPSGRQPPSHQPPGELPRRRRRGWRGARRSRGSAAEGRSAGRRQGAGPAGDGPAASGRHADESEVGSALALLALAYRSGLPTWDVLDAVADGLDGPPATDLRQVATALRWGATEREAWACVGPAWGPAARAVAVAHQAGVPPGPMLLAASDDLRAAELERLEVSAAKVGVRLVAPLGLVLLPAFCLTTVAPLVIALAGDLLEGRA